MQCMKLNCQLSLCIALTLWGWGTNNENINIDDRKWLTSTTFSSPRNINIEKVRRPYSSFLGGGPGPLSMLFFVPFKNEKKKRE